MIGGKVSDIKKVSKGFFRKHTTDNALKIYKDLKIVVIFALITEMIIFFLQCADI